MLCRFLLTAFESVIGLAGRRHSSRDRNPIVSLEYDEKVTKEYDTLKAVLNDHNIEWTNETRRNDVVQVFRAYAETVQDAFEDYLSVDRDPAYDYMNDLHNEDMPFSDFGKIGVLYKKMLGSDVALEDEEYQLFTDMYTKYIVGSNANITAELRYYACVVFYLFMSVLDDRGLEDFITAAMDEVNLQHNIDLVKPPQNPNEPYAREIRALVCGIDAIIMRKMRLWKPVSAVPGLFALCSPVVPSLLQRGRRPHRSTAVRHPAGHTRAVHFSSELASRTKERTVECHSPAALQLVSAQRPRSRADARTNGK